MKYDLFFKKLHGELREFKHDYEGKPRAQAQASLGLPLPLARRYERC